MKKQLRFIITVFVFACISIPANAFDYNITFTGSGASTTVDSVVVQNLSKGKQVTVPSGLQFRLTELNSGINEINSIANLAFVYPNPMTGNATYTFTAKYAGKTQISVFRLDGRKVTALDADLQQGKNSFQLALPTGVYLLQATGNGFSYTTKTISLSMVTSEPKINFSGNAANIKKPQRAPAPEVILQYSTGDQILYKGYSGNYCTIVTDKPTETKTTDFKFVECTDADGNNYAVVHIGTQTWMAENLKTTRYRNGDLIETTSPATKEVSTTSQPKYQWAFDGDENNVAKYGRLYTWYAVTDTRYIAPARWHVPSDAEWATLEKYLIDNGYSNDGTSKGRIAKSLAAITDWYTSTLVAAVGNDLTKNNSSGFSALPGGYRYPNGTFSRIGYLGFWWSSIETSGTNAGYTELSFETNFLINYYHMKVNGFSVRCISTY